MTKSIQVGAIVPDFELETYDPKSGDFGEVSLENLRSAGKWTILCFYPADFTFVWATEFAALAGLQARFEKLGAELITVSTDTKFSHLAWHTVEKELADARFQMGSDPTGKLAKRFGVYIKQAGLALRGTFLIDPQGKLLFTEVNFLNVGRNFDELMRKFKAALYVSKKDEGIPSTWNEEGDLTLKPSAKMVGKVHEALANDGKAS